MTVLENKPREKFGSAIILAGGKSSRMGFDKQFMEIENQKLMDKLINELEKDFDEIIIVTNKLEEYKDSKHKITSDIIVGRGPLSGIHSGLMEASYKYSFVVACDMPKINLDYIRYMKKVLEEELDGCVTLLGNHLEPFHGFYSKDIIEDIEKYLKKNRKSVNSFIKELNFKYIEESCARKFSPNLDIFSNLNTLEDLKSYKNSQ